MRKTIIALMMVLPILFVFVIFSAGTAASINILVSANGIKILNRPENDTLVVDLATYQNDFVVSAQVYPEKASNQNYSVRVEEVEGSQFADVQVDQQGKVSAQSLGAAKVVVQSNDGGYTDSFKVLVGSSKPVDFDFSISNATTQQQISFVRQQNKFVAENVETGLYNFSSVITPNNFSQTQLKVLAGFAKIDYSAGTILFPFSGTTTIKATVPDGAKGDIEKTFQFDVQKMQTTSPFLINGGITDTIMVDKTSKAASFYVQAASQPALQQNAFVSNSQIQKIENPNCSEQCFLVNVEFEENVPESVALKISLGTQSQDVNFTFADFGFSVRSNLPVQTGENATILVGKPVTFYAVPSIMAQGITYKWQLWQSPDEKNENSVTIETNSDGTICTVTAHKACNFDLSACAYQNSVMMDIFPVQTSISAIQEISSVEISNLTDLGLAKNLTIAGWKYNGEGSKVENLYQLNISTLNVSVPVDGIADLDFEVSNPQIASVKTLPLAEENAKIGVFVQPLQSGHVTISANWKGNKSFATQIGAAISLDVAKDAVQVSTSSQLFHVMEKDETTLKGTAVVLENDISLGTDDQGEPLPKASLKAVLDSEDHQMLSTYNTQFYANLGQPEQAKVKFVLEISNNIYGNGHTINAHNFTTLNEQGYFRGPLNFVSLGEGSASVKGQDNIAFLVRTDDVMVYNTTLLGCDDDYLTVKTDENKEAVNSLLKLENVGTTLEVNADAKFVNCRIRNGRNVVRAYGGNRDGQHYFVEDLSQNTPCSQERIDVEISGCEILNAREFLVKIGANRALRGSAEDLSPSLLKQAQTAAGAQTQPADAQQQAYRAGDNTLWKDEYFYNNYVLSDVTISDSVLADSGLFTIGLESNFAGFIFSIHPDWQNAEATSFASVLRLKGDVRLYDWKVLANVNSDTLIDNPANTMEMKLNIGAMLNFVREYDPENYGNIIDEVGSEGATTQYVHGGIACYGGGKNYAQVVLDDLDENLKDLNEYDINISILAESSESTLQQQGRLLPLAAGSEDFRFFLYDNQSQNNLAAQTQNKQNQSIKSIPLFAD